MQNSDARVRFLRSIEKLIESDPDEAMHRVVRALDDEHDDPALLYMVGNIFAKADHHGLALHLYKAALNLAPERPECWNNYGMALNGLGKHEAAREAFLNAKKRVDASSVRDLANYVSNVALTYMEVGERRKAIEWAEKAIAIDPSCAGAQQTIGFCSLALGDWGRGWKGYAAALGNKFRKIVKVGDEPRWNGERVKTLFVYGEQGLGDEIMMSSCLPDVRGDCDKLVVECDKRLAGLFKRSFPFADVYGTRKVAEVSWPSRYAIDAGVAAGDLPLYYRPSPASCPGTAFLTADPERRIQWRALLDSWGPRPKIGLCWSGGRRWTNERGRSIPLDAFRPLIESIDADWISLQYRDPSAEIAQSGLPVRHYARAVQSDDYDDTAALVAELDLVVGVHTAVQHLAGGIGVPTIVLVPQRPSWIWSLPEMPWYGSVRLFRQREKETWSSAIKRLATSDSEHLDRVRSAGSRSVSRLRAVDSGHGQRAGCDQAADAVGSEVVLQSSGRHEQLHHEPIPHPIVAGLRRVGAVH